MPEGELRQVLVELRDLLDDADEQFWAGWARDRLVALDSGALDPREVRRAFGGMGSLNDLLLDPFNGHTIEPAASSWTSRALILGARSPGRSRPRPA
ncbi:DUF6966 domain-containing protein [Cellulomonas gilvus]|uniref:DUF6966 domain-containing protein n=1 Tax=Cellulomonas gilvus TaxID=11 RepID=UPI0038995214